MMLFRVIAVSQCAAPAVIQSLQSGHALTKAQLKECIVR